MKRILAASFFLLLFLAAGLAWAYARWIHVDDRRLPAVETAGEYSEQRWLFSQGLFFHGLSHKLDVGKKKYRAGVLALAERFGLRAIVGSERFASPYQVFLSMGRYPQRLEGRDAILIPAGRTLTLSPDLQGAYLLEMPVIASDPGSQLEIRRNGRRIILAGIPALERATEGDGDSPFDVFLGVEDSVPASGWGRVRVESPFQPGDNLELRCLAPAGGSCIVGEVGFFLRGPVEGGGDKKNIVLIVIDTLRHDFALGGNAPALGTFFEEAAVFPDALAPGNMTSPSTNALLSCRRPSAIPEVAFAYGLSEAAREKYYRDQPWGFPGLLTAGTPTRFADGLKRNAGYESAMVGNISVLSEIYGAGANHGFRSFFALEQEGYETAASVLEARRWIRSNHDKRFFLYLHLNAPHAAYRPPLRDLRRAFPGFSALRSYPDVLRWLYQGEVGYVDRVIAGLFAELKSMRLYDDSLIVVTSDHGDQHAVIDLNDNLLGEAVTGSYFDHGATLFNDEILVPLAIKMPGLAPSPAAGAKGGFVSTLAVGPTLLSASGYPVPSHCSQKALPVLSPVAKRKAVIGFEGFRERGILYKDRFKYIRSYEPTVKRFYSPSSWSPVRLSRYSQEALYDLKSDPEEKENLAVVGHRELPRARARFAGYYGLRECRELVVNLARPGNMRILVTPGTGLEMPRGDWPPEVFASGASMPAGLHRLPLPSVPQAGEMGPPAEAQQAVEQAAGISVEFDGSGLPLKFMSTRLPIASVDFASSPPELMLSRFLEPSGEAEAYVVKTLCNDQAVYEIKTDNQEFERVLRQWGYVNDQE